MIVVWRTRRWLLLVFGAVAAAVMVWAVLRPAVPELAAGRLSPAAAESLAVYVEPSAPLPGIDDYGIHLPALPPSAPVRTAQTLPEEDAPAPWRLSAILISGDRPVAVVDDQPVRPGERLPDGSRVESIEADGVTVIDPRGRRHILRLPAGG